MLENKLINIIKKLTGSLLVFGVNNSKIIDTIDNNANISYCDLLNCNYDSQDGKGYNIYIKSIRKKYKKKRVDIMLINIDNSLNYTRKLIKDSIYVTKNNIYLYGSLDNINSTIKKYKRYNIKIEKTNLENKCLVKIDVGLAKNNIIKDFIYYIYDTFIYIIDKIGDVMS